MLRAGVFLIDSGCVRHLCSNISLFSELKEHTVYFTCANGAPLRSHGIGAVKFRYRAGKEWKVVTVHGVHYVPECKFNLLSFGALTMLIPTVTDEKGMYVDGIWVGRRLPHERNLFECAWEPIASAVPPVLVVANLHERLGHPGKAVEDAVRKKYPEEVGGGKGCESKVCEVCAMSKSFKLRPRVDVEAESKRADHPLAKLSSDLTGPRSSSVSVEKYLLVIVDKYSRYILATPITNKSDAAQQIKFFVQRAEREFSSRGYKVVRFQSDNGGEYVNAELGSFFRAQGIDPTTTVPHSSHQNGGAERTIRTIEDKARSLLVASGLPEDFFMEAAMAAVFLLNRLPSSAIKMETPFERWTCRRATLERVKAFGCLCFVHVPAEKRSKSAPNGMKGIMLGYAPARQAYRVLLVATGRIVESHLVKFVETEFPCLDETFRAALIWQRSLFFGAGGVQPEPSPVTGGRVLSSTSALDDEDEVPEAEPFARHFEHERTDTYEDADGAVWEHGLIGVSSEVTTSTLLSVSLSGTDSPHPNLSQWSSCPDLSASESVSSKEIRDLSSALVDTSGPPQGFYTKWPRDHAWRSCAGVADTTGC